MTVPDRMTRQFRMAVSCHLRGSWTLTQPSATVSLRRARRVWHGFTGEAGWPKGAGGKHSRRTTCRRRKHSCIEKGLAMLWEAVAPFTAEASADSGSLRLSCNDRCQPNQRFAACHRHHVKETVSCHG